MMTIFFRGLGSTIRVNVLWQIAFLTNLDNLVRKKWRNFLEQVEDFRDDMGSNLFLFLLLGLCYFSF